MWYQRECAEEGAAFGGNPFANAIARRGRKAVRVRESAYDACTEIANFTVKKRNTRVALRGLFHVACLLIMFFDGRLAMPCTDVRK